MGKDINGANDFVTREDIRMLVEMLCKIDLYIRESSYRLQIGLSRSHFHHLRKLGKFDGGYHPYRRDGKKRLLHRFYNMHLGKVVLPGLNCAETAAPARSEG